VDEMKQRPILFSGPMVRAILEGRKTQTRRVIKPQLPDRTESIEMTESGIWCIGGDNPSQRFGEVYMNDWSFGIRCPYGQPGDRLWVRETCAIGFSDEGELVCDYMADGERRWFERTIYNDADPGWITYINDGKRPSIFMPRWASRITLEVTGVRAEQLQDISQADARDEGVECPLGSHSDLEIGYRLAFRDLWDSLNAKSGYTWDGNNWVWVIEFQRKATP
jgi:hypothetical protein